MRRLRAVVARARKLAATAGSHLRLTSATSMAVVVATVLGSLANAALLLPSDNDRSLLRAAALVLAADALLFAPLFALRLALGPRADQPRPWLLVAALAVLAPLRSVALFGVADGGEVAPHILVNSAVLVALVVLGATVLADSVRQEVRRVNMIAALDEADAAVRDRVDGLLAQQRELIEGEVKDAMQPGIEQLAQLPGPTAVAELRQIAHDVVRPLSHDLLASPPAIASPPVRAQDYRLDLRLLVGDATAAGRLPSAELALCLFALPVAFYLAFGDAGLPLSRAVVSSLVLWGSAVLLNSLSAGSIARLAAVPRALAVTAELVALGLVQSLLGIAVLFDPQHSQRGALVAPALTVVVGWVILIARSVGRTHDATIAGVASAQARLDWQVAHANARLSALRGALARQLHGPVQVSLNAGAIRLDRATAAGEDHMSADLAQTVADSVVEAVAGLAEVPEIVRDPRMALDRVRVTWEGLCQVTLEDSNGLLDDITTDPACASAVADIITESCSDAVRHGRAEHVSMALARPLDDVVRITVTDDGTGGLGGSGGYSGSPGLGSAFLDAVTLAWSRTTGAGGTVLTADLPFGCPGQSALRGPTEGFRSSP